MSSQPLPPPSACPGSALSSALSTLISSGASWRPAKTIGDTTVHTLSDVHYGEDSPLQSLDLYFPDDLVAPYIADKGDTPPPPQPTITPRPVYIHIHGGGWSRGDKASRFYGGPAMSQNAAAHGCIAVAPGYRLGMYPEFVHDAAAAIQWVRENIPDLGGDLTNVFLSGHSAGSHIASLLVLRHSCFLGPLGIPPDFFRGLVLVSGVYDLFSPMRKAMLDSKNKWFVVAYVIPAFGTNEKLRREASPLLLLDPSKDTSVLGTAAKKVTDSFSQSSAGKLVTESFTRSSVVKRVTDSFSQSSSQDIEEEVTTEFDINTSSLPPTLILNASFDMGLQENGELMAEAMAKHTDVKYERIPKTDHASICWNENTFNEVNSFIDAHIKREAHPSTATAGEGSDTERAVK